MTWLGAVRQPTTEPSFERALRASSFCGQTLFERCPCMHYFALLFNDAGAGAQVLVVLSSPRVYGCFVVPFSTARCHGIMVAECCADCHCSLGYGRLQRTFSYYSSMSMRWVAARF